MIAADAKIDDAVQFAKDFLSGPVLHNDVMTSSAQGHENVTKRLRMFDKLVTRAAAQSVPIQALFQDTNDFDALVTITADVLYENQRMPEFLAIFAADVLSGKCKRPTKRGADKYRNWARDYTLMRATQEVAKAFKLPHYTNNELSAKTTAAKIVSEAVDCNLDVVITAYKKMRRYNPESATSRCVEIPTDQ